MIISNSCCGAYLMREHFKMEYNNPFCWNVIDLESYYNLIKNWNKIDFLNYELVKDENWHFSIIIDNIVKVQYIHYLFDKDVKVLSQKSKDESDILVWNKMYEYVVEKYEERVNRLLSIKHIEKPFFIIADTKDSDVRKYNEFWLNKIDELDTKLLYVSQSHKVYPLGECLFHETEIIFISTR
jgi:esterase/lipase